jgi:hypothetical protein
MDHDEIEALRESVRLLRDGHDDIEAMAQGGALVMSAGTRDDLRRVASHIDEHVSRGEAVTGDGFVILLD